MPRARGLLPRRRAAVHGTGNGAHGGADAVSRAREGRGGDVGEDFGRVDGQEIGEDVYFLCR